MAPLYRPETPRSFPAPELGKFRDFPVDGKGQIPFLSAVETHSHFVQIREPTTQLNSMTLLRSSSSVRQPLLSAMIGMALVSAAQAGSRHFTYSYETTTMAAGAMELESWLTWKSQQADDPGTDSFNLRHEFEYGVTDRLQLAFYFADWNYERPGNGKSGADFKDVA